MSLHKMAIKCLIDSAKRSHKESRALFKAYVNCSDAAKRREIMILWQESQANVEQALSGARYLLDMEVN